jgi:hypothetical protein
VFLIEIRNGLAQDIRYKKKAPVSLSLIALIPVLLRIPT